jgi:Ca-activated chloride channel family protein
MHVGAPEWMHALWAVPAIVLAWVYAWTRTTRLLARFADLPLLGVIAQPRGTVRSWTKILLSAASTGLIASALLRPQWNEREVPVARQGREIVFLVDVSRSMLASDLAPNRLERAKIWIRDLVAAVDGDSVGLVAFAGAAVVKCPLSRDLGFFDLTLEELGPESVPVGGSMIGDAIRKTISQVFERDPTRDTIDGTYRDIVLITDGEDQGSLPVEAAESAAQAGVRIIAIGLGGDGEGALVPAADEDGQFATYQGQAVRSRLDAAALADIAAATPGGVFLNVGIGNVALDDVYRQLIASADQTSLESSDAMQYDEMFWVFLAAALGLLVIEPLLGDRVRRST